MASRAAQLEFAKYEGLGNDFILVYSHLPAGLRFTTSGSHFQLPLIVLNSQCIAGRQPA